MKKGPLCTSNPLQTGDSCCNLHQQKNKAGSADICKWLKLVFDWLLHRLSSTQKDLGQIFAQTNTQRHNLTWFIPFSFNDDPPGDDKTDGCLFSLPFVYLKNFVSFFSGWRKPVNLEINQLPYFPKVQMRFIISWSTNVAFFLSISWSSNISFSAVGRTALLILLWDS